MSRGGLVSFLVLCFIAGGVSIEALAESGVVPPCRLDASAQESVRQAFTHALEAFKAEKVALPFDRVEVNPSGPVLKESLRVEIVKDATKDKVDQKGCLEKTGDGVGRARLDVITVPGGCYVSSDIPNLIRCSSSAVTAFMAHTSAQGPASSALLYVFAHELAHVHQRRRGEFSGRIDSIDLGRSKGEKLKQLDQNCTPGLVTREEEADNIALMVLKKRLSLPPYREPLFSSKGSMYWNIDRIRLAATEWDKVHQEQLDQREIKVHDVFDPDQHLELPATREVVRSAARRFTCDVIQSTKGTIRYPARQSTHPSPERRLRRIAEVLGVMASSLSNSGGSQEYAPLKELQENVSPIFAFFDQQFGIYTENVHGEICSLVNSGHADNVCQ